MTDKRELISFVIPCYNSELSIGTVVNEIIKEMTQDGRTKKYDYEIILINDGSADNTLDVIMGLQKNNNRIVAVDLTRNFGQAAAQMAGFNLVKGDFVFSLDDDGQMPIESIFSLIDKLKEGYDVVFGRYEDVKQAWYRNIGSKINVKMSEILLGKPKELYISSFWVGRRLIIDEIIRYQGPYPYIGGLLLRVSRNMTSVLVKERERINGVSNYTFTKLIHLWMNGFTAFSIVPLRIASAVGMISALIGFIYGVISIVRKILNPSILLGYSSLIVIILLLGGIMMILLGMLGEYMGRIYLNINQAPQFVVRSAYDERGSKS